ncbi:hypothetical protein RI129_012752 [Pyrocoelia pectoralis]|uniref:DDE Tnp4 domain-containing protein n=1 Tax=Pyrocoelia pectoralis TaxID=417401 RepID=A0AAN7UYW0_9COLE
MAFVEEEFFIDDDLDILDIVEFGFPRKIYNRTNHFEDLDNLTFFKRFRLTKNTVLHLLELIEVDFEYDNNLNNSVTPIDQLLAVLRFYASAGHLSTVSDFIGMDVSTASRIVAKVTRAIARLYPQFVKMLGPNDLIQAQTDFYRVVSFPRVIGCVDGTHIRIQSPGGEDPEVFRNRKGYFSINVQGICDANLTLLDVVARWPGSTNDSTIFNNSRIRRRFENNEFPNCLLLGDSGYIVRNYFLTPLLNPLLRNERLYNEAHIRSRNVIERCFGVWKRRFPVLAYGMRLKLNTVLQVIIATAVLHNLAKRMNEEEPPLPDDVNQEEVNYLIAIADIGDVPNINQNVHVNHFRDHLIRDYFSRL